MIFILFIHFKMPNISRIDRTSERLKTSFFFSQHFSFNEQLKCHALLSMNIFIISGPSFIMLLCFPFCGKHLLWDERVVFSNCLLAFSVNFLQTFYFRETSLREKKTLAK